MMALVSPPRYMKHLLGVKQQQRGGGASLSWNQLQEGINAVNNSVQDEHERTTHTHTGRSATVRTVCDL